MKPLSMSIKRIFLLLLFLGLPVAFAETTQDGSGIPGVIFEWKEDGTTCKFKSDQNEVYYVKLWLVDAPKKEEDEPKYKKMMDFVRSDSTYGANNHAELKIIAENPDKPSYVFGILTKPGYPSSCQQKFWESGYFGLNDDERETKRSQGEALNLIKIYYQIQKEKQEAEQPKKAEKSVRKVSNIEFMNAVAGDDPDKVKSLLESGAASATAKFPGTDTALTRAARHGNLDIVKLLVEHGADVNAVDNDGPSGYKNTALIRAAENRHSDVVKFLVEHGADVNAQRTDGHTALFFAVEKGLDLKTIELLLDKGADPNVKVKVGHDYYVSLIYRAKNWGKSGPSKGEEPSEEELKYQKELVDLLIEHGAVDEKEERAKKMEAQKAKNAGAPIPGFGTNTPRKDALKGTFFDLTTPPKKRGSNVGGARSDDRESAEHNKYAYDKGFHEKQLRGDIHTLSTAWNIGNIKSRHPVIEPALYTTSIYATSSPREMKVGNCWLCYYEGYFGVPEEGDYRFVGYAETAMLVGVGVDKRGNDSKETKTVLYAFEPGKGYGLEVKCEKDWEPAGFCGVQGDDGLEMGQEESIGKRLYKGSWLHLIPGKRYPIRIAFGTTSGNIQVKLGIQKMDRDTDENFPLFTLEKVKSYPKKKLDEINAEIEEIKSKLPSVGKPRSGVTVPQEEQELTARRSWLEKQRGDLGKQRGDLTARPDTGPYNMSDIFAVQEPPPKEKAATTKKSSGDGKKTRKHTTQSPKS